MSKEHFRWSSYAALLKLVAFSNKDLQLLIRQHVFKRTLSTVLPPLTLAEVMPMMNSVLLDLLSCSPLIHVQQDFEQIV